MAAVTRQRKVVLALSLVATLSLVFWVDRQEPEGDGVILARPDRQAGKPAPRRAGAEATLPSLLDWQQLAGRDAVVGPPAADLFRPHRWYVPPPPKPAEPPPPKPVAPPAPFTYLGKMEDTPQGTLLILSAGGKVYTVAAGEPIDSSWRLDGDDAGSVRLTYLPLGLPQTLPKSAKPAGAKPNPTRKTEPQGTAS